MSSSHAPITFKVLSGPWHVPGSGRKATAYLVDDNWDDFGFKTLFSLIVFDENGTKHQIGYVKIAKFGMAAGMHGRTEVPQTFTRLEDTYFSLGQDDTYYESLSRLSKRIGHAVLLGLRDVVLNNDLWRHARNQAVTIKSLLRTVTPKSVSGQYRRIIQGGARRTEYDFIYTVPKRMTDRNYRLELTFAVKPESPPQPTFMSLSAEMVSGRLIYYN